MSANQAVEAAFRAARVWTLEGEAPLRDHVVEVGPDGRIALLRPARASDEAHRRFGTTALLPTLITRGACDPGPSRERCLDASPERLTDRGSTEASCCDSPALRLEDAPDSRSIYVKLVVRAFGAASALEPSAHPHAATRDQCPKFAGHDACGWVRSWAHSCSPAA